jgi:Beta-galactosidase
MHTRRDFLKTAVLASPAWNCISSLPAWAQARPAATGRFLFGASVYPDINGGAEQGDAAVHPEMLVVLEPGADPSDLMSRNCPCLNHRLYRAACRRYIQALAGKFHDHPAVIGWQLDNEIEFLDQMTKRSIPAQLTLKPYETLLLDAHVVRFSETLAAI